MARKISMLAPEWWDYTTLDDEILNDAAKLTAEDLAGLSREGLRVVFYDTLEDFYLAEALEYVTAWKQATTDNPAGLCGPIGPTEQLPLVARLVNELRLDLSNAHFWGMDEWYMEGREVPRPNTSRAGRVFAAWLCKVARAISNTGRSTTPSSAKASTRTGHPRRKSMAD
jgi:glucosamine-6-phosphate deaminase